MSKQAIFSGGPIKRFRGGWALIPFAERCHLWRRMDHQNELRARLKAPAGITFYKAACGHCEATTPRLPALEPGNVPKCKRCAKARVAA